MVGWDGGVGNPGEKQVESLQDVGRLRNGSRIPKLAGSGRKWKLTRDGAGTGNKW